MIAIKNSCNISVHVNKPQLQLYFLALLPPAKLQEDITAIKHELADRYNCRHALKSPPHITMFPPFKWPVSQAEQLCCLSDFAAQQAPIPVTLSGFGAFPPRVIYVRPLKTPELLLAYQTLQTFLKQRQFCPHIAVANRDLRKEIFREVWPEFEGRSLQAEFIATHLTLLRHNGRCWDIDREWSFAG